MQNRSRRIFLPLPVFRYNGNKNKMEKQPNNGNFSGGGKKPLAARLKRLVPDALAVVLFILLGLVYFFTPVTQGLVLTGHDTTAGIGVSHERMEYLQRTGEETRWTNALFGGMPTYQIAPSYESRNLLSAAERVYELGMTGCVMYVFILLLGFYILLRALKVRPAVSVFGAVAWAFSSYFFIIIGAGHIWKLLTLAFIPPTLAGMVLCYRGKYLWGGVLSAFFVAWQILSNHLQMTYYFLFVIALMSVGFLVAAIKERQLARFFKGVGVFVAAGLIGIAVNASNLYHTYDYSKHTMRGSSELSQPASDNGKKASSSGLSHEYITQWSYGIGETWSLLVPNVKGGASGALPQNEQAQKNPRYSSYMQTFQQLYGQLGSATPGLSQYWGEQPGTSGPVYVGAFVCLLFILSLFFVKGPLKWSLLAVTVLSVLLSWGHNFPTFTDWMIDNFPMYNKFRAVSSALVVAEFAIPLLAVLCLAKIIEEPEILRRRQKLFFVVSGATAGVCLLFAIAPGTFFGDCLTANEHLILQDMRSVLDPMLVNTYASDISAIRHDILSADAWRSFWVVVIGFALLFIYRSGKVRPVYAAVALIVLCLADMWMVNRRYLNDTMFVESYNSEQPFTMSEADRVILQDKSPDYRVLNFASDTFNENETSYWHKSVGGYHAAKLGRYQDLITNCISPEMNAVRKALPAALAENSTAFSADSVCPTINMLNTKYFILPGQQGGRIPLANPNAYGNAWFVGKIMYAASAAEEMSTLKSIDRRREAVVGKDFAAALGNVTELQCDTADVIRLTAYEPNKLTYEVSAKNDGVVVLSEVYYPGWKAEIDGAETPIARADYVLRAVKVPAGKHTLVLTFDPVTLRTTEAVAYAALAVMFVALIVAVVISLRRRKSVEAGR